ncbi:MAG: MCP four helix bundle domain-containing protein, partial [Burkholderiaceae bacterium]
MNQMKVATRLSLGFGLVLAMMAIVIGLSIVRMGNMYADTDKIVHDDYPKVSLAQQVRDNLNQSARAVRNMILATDPETVNAELARMQDNRRENTETLNKLDGLVRSETGTALLKDVKEKIGPYRAAVDQATKLIGEGNKDQAIALVFGDLRTAQQAYFKSIDALVEHQAQGMDKMAKAAEESYFSARNTIIGLGIAALLLGAGAAFIITRTLLKQLGGEPEYAAAIAGKIAAGDLAVQIDLKPNDKSSMLLAMKAMRDSLVKIVGEVRTGTDTISTASSEIATGNLDLSSRTEEQASSLEEPAASMEELTSTVKQNADNAR